MSGCLAGRVADRTLVAGCTRTDCAYDRLCPLYSFFRHLEKLAHSEAGKGRERGRLDRFLAKLVCRSRTEQACFRLSASMLKNERV